MKTKTTVDEESHAWSPCWRGDLASAMSGGQWPQARKAAVPSWGINDAIRQLCHAAMGTLDHRFACSMSRPEGGWKVPPQEALLARNRIGAELLQILKHRGLLVLRLPAPPRREEWFEWLLCPPLANEESNQFIWYLDGSLLDGEWIDYKATGFGIVVVSPGGTLVGYGRGCPPEWCATAAAAETWALAMALMLADVPPRLRTDCRSLLVIAEEGHPKAPGADKPLARVRAIFFLPS